MGTIDEGYVDNNNVNEQSSAVINRTKYPAMIPSPVQNHNLTTSATVKDESLNRLKYESSRLLTFDKWPASAKVEPRKIAKAGFFYTGQYAEAKCLWCDCVITTWEYGDQVMTRHRSASPDCPFVRDVSDNIPLLSSVASSNNIIITQASEDQNINNESTVDIIDYVHQHGTGSNNSNTFSGSSNAETISETEDSDGVRDQSDVYTNRISDDTRRMSSTRSQNETRMPVVSENPSPNHRQTGMDWHHPVSGRRLPEDFENRPIASSLLSPDINDDIYKRESERLKTFGAWTISFIRPADLANAGFVYTGRGDCVRCVFCREHMGEWDEDDFPHTEHRALFPHCPFVRGLDVGNIATNNSEILQAMPAMVNSRSLNDQAMQRRNVLSGRDDHGRNVMPSLSQAQHLRRNSSTTHLRADVRVRPHSGHNITSYQRQHSDQPQRPRSTSYDNHPAFDRNNMEHSSRPQSMAPSNLQTHPHLMEEESYDVAGIRPRQSGGPEKGVLHLNNPGGANRKAGGANKQPGTSCPVAGQPEDIGIIRHSGPANSKYSTVEARTRTFREWPPALRQQPAQLSEAGFFYIGLSDQVKCFYCDGGLRNWQAEDDPWTEHARWFSECGFVRLVKGDEFISKCLNSHPPVPVQGVPVVSRDRSRSAVSEVELHKMMSSPLVHQVLAMGVDSTRVKKALKQRIQETGSGFKFVNELVEATILQAAENFTPMSAERLQSPSYINERATSASTGPSTSNQSIPSQTQVPLAESQPGSSNADPNMLTTELSNMLAFGATSNESGSSD